MAILQMTIEDRSHLMSRLIIMITHGRAGRMSSSRITVSIRGVRGRSEALWCLMIVALRKVLQQIRNSMIDLVQTNLSKTMGPGGKSCPACLFATIAAAASKYRRGRFKWASAATFRGAKAGRKLRLILWLPFPVEGRASGLLG